MAAIRLPGSANMAESNFTPPTNGAQSAGRHNHRAPPSDESYEHEDLTIQNPKDAHSSDQMGRTFSARARDQSENKSNYLIRKPVPSSTEELLESTMPRGLPSNPDPKAMPEIQVSSPPPGVSPSPARSQTTRSGSANDSRRDWASDRSPLQKLEVTLTGISKEEKRARVQEAEIKARERIARKKAQQEKAALAVADAHAPSLEAGKSNGRDDIPSDHGMRNGHADVSSQRKSGNTAVRHSRTDSRNPQCPAVRRPEDARLAQVQAAIPPSAQMGNVPKRPVTVTGPAQAGAGPKITHSRSMSQAGPQPTQAPSALKAERINDLSLAPLAPQDSSESQSKPKNVSFDVPPSTPPPIFEWRGAQPAQLRASDFDFQTLDINRSKAWWEGGDNKDRRKSRALPKNYRTPAQKLTGKKCPGLPNYHVCQCPVERTR